MPCSSPPWSSASAAAVEGFAEVVAHLRKSPVLTRNITVAGLSLPPHPRWLLTLRRGC